MLAKENRADAVFVVGDNTGWTGLLAIATESPSACVFSGSSDLDDVFSKPTEDEVAEDEVEKD